MDKLNKFNEWLAVQITNKVGTVWAAYVFTLMVMFAVIYPPSQQIIFFVSSAFLQLVFLPIIMVGGDVQSRATQKLIQQINDNTMIELQKQNEEFVVIKEMMLKQNQLIELMKQEAKDEKEQKEELLTIIHELNEHVFHIRGE